MADQDGLSLMCPKYRFSGKDWWAGLVATIRKLAQEDKFKDMELPDPHHQQGLQWSDLPPQHTRQRPPLAQRGIDTTRGYPRLGRPTDVALPESLLFQTARFNLGFPAPSGNTWAIGLPSPGSKETWWYRSGTRWHPRWTT